MNKTIALLIAILIGFGASCFAQGKVSNQKATVRTTKTTSQKKSQKANSTPKPDIGEPDGMVDGHGYVDLGLPSGTKWAYTNFGATKPTDKGFLYEWGNLVPGDKNNVDIKGDITGNPNYDVSAYSWGKNWSIPTESKWKELFACCEVTEFFIDSKRFFKVQSTNGKFIILPTTRSVSGDDCAFYWTSTYRDSFDGGRAQKVSIYNPNNIHIDATYISIPNLIRPVISTVNNVNNTTSEGKIASTSNLAENTDKKTYNGYINGYEYVDLGLPSGLKWATCNLGATKPEEYGDYFAWGEQKSRLQGSTCVSKNTDVSKLEQKGIIDGMKRLTPFCDAATFSWGSSWRMPTREDFNELLINCGCTAKTYHGVRGIEFTGPNGQTIFLPGAGRFDGKKREYDIYYYWTSTPVGKYSAYCGFDCRYMGQPIGKDGHCSLTEYNREYFQSIRPVSE